MVVWFCIGKRAIKGQSLTNALSISPFMVNPTEQRMKETGKEGQ